MGTNKTKSTIIIVFLFLNICFSVYLFMVSNNKKIVSFNMKETVNLLIDELKEENLNEDQIKVVTQNFNLSLDEAIKKYSQKNNVIILVSPAVVSGSDDVTLDIQNMISDYMAKRQ